MKTLYTMLAAVLIAGSVSAQCLTISCNSNVAVSNDNNSCGAIVNFTTPVVTAYTCTTAAQDTFNYTGTQQTWVVPPGVTTVNIQTWGAQGGSNWINNNNFGGYVSADITVTPGSTLYIYVGGQATTTAGGFNGGGNGEGAGKGGGGGTDVRIGGTTYNDRVVVAGGGGGGGYWSNLHVVGGQGGGLTGTNGYRDPSYATNPGGLGGTQSAGGANGTCVSLNVVACAGGFGYGGSITGCGCEVYGGGGGWYGGAASGNCRGGGGGSGYAIPSATNVVMQTGVRTGNGRVIIGYAAGVPPVIQTAGMPSGSLFPVGTTTNIFTSTDGMNTATCSFDVTVFDIQAPAITGLPSGITQSADSGQCGAIVNWSAISATDNCSAVITSSANSGDFFPLGTTVVTVIATDPSANADTSSFSVTVVDSESPVIANMPSAIALSNDSGQCSAVATWSAPSATDNCNTTLTSTHNSGDTFAVGTTTVIYIASDPAGNSDTASFTVTVSDTEVPAILCAQNVTVSADSGMCSASNVQMGTLSYSDNCSATSSNDAPSVFPVGTTIVTHTVTDAAGNSVTCQQSITVTDDEAPFFTDCPQNISMCPGIVQYNAPGASDNCSVTVNQLSGPASGSTLSAGNYTVVFVATDSAGNTDTCSFAIAVNANPVITTNNAATVCVTDGSLTLSASPAGGIWSGTAVTGNTFSPGTAGNGQHVLTYSYTDVNGCSATAMDTITVSPCVGMNEHGVATFSLFPNPANSTFTFSCAAQGTLVLMDAIGNVVFATPIVDSQTQIGIEGIAAGAYIVQFTNVNGTVSNGTLQIQR